MNKTNVPFKLLFTFILLTALSTTLFAQWEPTGKLERTEPPVNAFLDPDIIKATPTRVTADNSGTVAITTKKDIWKNAGTAWVTFIPVVDGVKVERFPFGAVDEYAFEDVTAYNGITYVVVGSGKIYQVDEKGWFVMPGDERARRIAADNKGQLWIVDKNYAVKYFDSKNNTWTVYPGNAKANDIAAYNGTPVIVAQPSGNILYGTGTRWEQVGNLQLSCTNVSIDPTNGMVWMITGPKNTIWAHTASGVREYPGGATAFDVCGYNGSPYILNRSNEVMKGKSTDPVFTSPGAIESKVEAAPTQAVAVTESTPVVAAVVVAPSTTDPYIRTAKSTYKTNERIEVEFGNFEGSQFDWIALVEKGRPDDDYGTYNYTGGGSNGKVFISYGWTGTYELRGFFNNGKEVKARATIKLED